MYYEKVGLAYGQSSGREIFPDYPTTTIDIQAKVDEYRIVGSQGIEVGITSIKAGDGTNTSNVITATLSAPIPDLSVDTAIQIQGIGPSGYNGQFVVSAVNGETELQYKVQNPPSNPQPTSLGGATASVVVDTVTSASPYVFSVSLRSVFGMCGMWADGSKATGFKSMVVAQFTGISLQKDDNAFIKYNSNTGTYEGKNAPGNSNLNANSRAVYKPEYENWHIRASNNSFIQIVSVFAIGYARHFYADSGGDFSITNSNSNFGSVSLFGSGFRDDAFLRDDVGYITHIIPPKVPDDGEVTTEFGSIDVNTTIGVGNSSRLYLYEETNESVIPPYVIDGYRIGAKNNDTLNVNIPVDGVTLTHSAKIVIPNTQETREKINYVSRSGNTNVINTSNYVINLESTNTFINGEKIRVISENGELPDGIVPNQVYYAITVSDNFTNSSQIKLAQTFNDALNDRAIRINNRGGVLKIISRVSDKIPGEPGHPIIWDNTVNQWYLNVSPTNNTIYSTIVALDVAYIGDATPRTFIIRRPDTRNLIDTIYRIRYVIPAASTITSRPPVEGFILQESNSTTGDTTDEIQKYFSNLTVDLSNISELRNFKFIADAIWSSSVATIRTELPHNFSVGDSVEIYNVKSSLNTDGSERIGFNGKFIVSSVISRKEFTYRLTTNPGTFTSDTSLRTTSLPRVSRRKLNGIYSVYKSEEVQKYIKGEKDGIYYLTLVNASNSPTAEEFKSLKFSQPVQYLYPQSNRDEPIGDPEAAACSATSSLIGRVVINDPHTSITRETLDSNVKDFGVGIGITNIVSNAQGTVHTIYPKIEHGLNSAVSVSILNSGVNYGTGIGVTQVLYNAKLVSEVGDGFGENATARVTVNPVGQIIDVKIMDGGTSYGIGNTFAIVGIATTTGHARGVVQITNIVNNVGDNFVIDGIRDKNYSQYNGVYRITAVSASSPSVIEAVSTNPIPSPAVGGISPSFLDKSYLALTGKSKLVSSLTYDNVSGIATVITSTAHGLRKDNRIILSGADDSLFNDSFVIDRVVGLSTFILHLPTSPTPVNTSGTIYTNHEGFNSRGGFISEDNENTDGRMISVYGNITTTLSSEIANLAVDEIFISNLTDYDFKIGDFIQIDEEILRISRKVPTTPGSSIKVFRGVLGTKSNIHPTGSVVRRINIYPIELRRNTIIRASGHTFEYVGYGPGNYSTALPDKQDRQLTAQEELLSISKKDSGAVIIFNGINSDGDYYIGNKKINSSTGQEEVFDTPVPSVTGEEIEETDTAIGFDVISPAEVSISRSIRVEGGSDKNIISQFDGPVVFNNKITSNSAKGVETHSLFLQGDSRISRKYTVGISTPTDSSNPGDVTFRSEPTAGDNIGWVFTGKNHWYQFGYISIEKDANVQIFDKVGIGITTPNNNLLQIGSATSSFYVNNSGNVAINTTPDPSYALTVNGVIFGDGSGLFNVSDIWEGDAVGVHTTTPVGVGTTSAREGFGLYVEGSAAFNGSLRVYEIIEKATISTSILTTGAPVNIDLGDNNVYYYTNEATGNWGVNFRAGVGLALTSFLSAGESMTVAILTTQGSTPYYNNAVNIDGVGITPKYSGGSTITSGNANGLDSYTYVVIRKDSTGNPSDDFTVLYSQSQYS
jgi:hypothetical protein